MISMRTALRSALILLLISHGARITAALADNYESMLEAAAVKYKNNEWEKAIKEYSSMLRDRGADPDILRLRGKCYLATGNFAAAKADLEAAGKIPGPLEQAMDNQHSININDLDELAYPDWLKALVLMYAARVSAEQGLLDKSQKLCDIALKRNKNFPECWTLRGNIMLKQNRLYESEENFRQALSLRPNDWHCWIGYATVLERQYKLNSALAAMDEAIETIKKPPYQESNLKMKAEYIAEKRDRLAARLNKR